MEVFATIYDLRVYHPVPWQVPKLLARFRDKLLPIWERHGISSHRLLDDWHEADISADRLNSASDPLSGHYVQIVTGGEHTRW